MLHAKLALACDFTWTCVSSYVVTHVYQHIPHDNQTDAQREAVLGCQVATARASNIELRGAAQAVYIPWSHV